MHQDQTPPNEAQSNDIMDSVFAKFTGIMKNAKDLSAKTRLFNRCKNNDSHRVGKWNISVVAFDKRLVSLKVNNENHFLRVSCSNF